MTSSEERIRHSGCARAACSSSTPSRESRWAPRTSSASLQTRNFLSWWPSTSSTLTRLTGRVCRRPSRKLWARNLSISSSRSTWARLSTGLWTCSPTNTIISRTTTAPVRTWRFRRTSRSRRKNCARSLSRGLPSMTIPLWRSSSSREVSPRTRSARASTAASWPERLIRYSVSAPRRI